MTANTVKKLLRKLTVVTSLLVILMMAASLLFAVLRYSAEKNRPVDDYAGRMELQYWKTRYDLVEEIDGWIKRNAEGSDLSGLVLLRECDRYGVDVRLPLAQGLLESHYGTTGLSRKTNSVWNLGAFDGTRLDSILGIYRYPHPNNSVEHYLKVLRKDYLTDGRTERDLIDSFTNRRGYRYATATTYEQELRLVWNRMSRETKIDSLMVEYKELKERTER